MCGARIFLIAVIVLAIAPVTKAELTLTVNGLDVAELPEINGTKDLVIAVAGENEAGARDISVTADSGSLEMLNRAYQGRGHLYMALLSVRICTGTIS